MEDGGGRHYTDPETGVTNTVTELGESQSETIIAKVIRHWQGKGTLAWVYWGFHFGGSHTNVCAAKADGESITRGGMA